MENGGIRLIYTNGIGGSPQQIGMAEVAATAAANRAATTQSGLPRKDSASVDRAGSDGAKLSTTAGVIAQAFAGSDVRLAKVAGMQQTIAAGTYSVSSPDVADKLMTALMR